MIEVINIAKVYGRKDNAFHALKNVSVTLPQGKTIAIVGKSGSGKSTLMHIMSGLDRPTSGDVRIEGRSVFAQKQKQIDAFRSKYISFIFQSFFVQGRETCYDNVALPLEIAGVPKRKRKALVQAALEAVELDQKINSRAKDLSGGQKQRLAVARAIVNSPKILFADEPTGNLDSATGEKVEQLLFGYAKKTGATLIVVTHDPDLAAKCDINIHVADGAITKVEGLDKPSKEAL